MSKSNKKCPICGYVEHEDSTICGECGYRFGEDLLKHIEVYRPFKKGSRIKATLIALFATGFICAVLMNGLPLLGVYPGSILVGLIYAGTFSLCEYIAITTIAPALENKKIRKMLKRNKNAVNQLRENSQNEGLREIFREYAEGASKTPEGVAARTHLTPVSTLEQLNRAIRDAEANVTPEPIITHEELYRFVSSGVITEDQAQTQHAAIREAENQRASDMEALEDMYAMRARLEAIEQAKSQVQTVAATDRPRRNALLILLSCLCSLFFISTIASGVISWRVYQRCEDDLEIQYDAAEAYRESLYESRRELRELEEENRNLTDNQNARYADGFFDACRDALKLVSWQLAYEGADETLTMELWETTYSTHSNGGGLSIMPKSDPVWLLPESRTYHTARCMSVLSGEDACVIVPACMVPREFSKCQVCSRFSN